MIITKPRERRRLVGLLTSFVLLTALSSQGRAQQLLSKESYMAAPPEIAEILHDENSYNRVSLSNPSPDGEFFLIPVSGGLASLEVMSRPYVNLAETAIDHNANRTRRLTIGTTLAYELFSLQTKMQMRIDSPRGTIVSSARWSPDGKSLAFMVHRRMGSYLFVADVKSGTSRQLSDAALLATLTSTLRWTWDSKKILTVIVPRDRGPRPTQDAVSRHPRILVNERGKTPTRTYRFLLKTPYEAKFLEYLSRGQLALVDAQSGELETIGKPAMFTSVDVSPDSRYFRVTTMQKPFSYIVPRSRFGTREELWDKRGKVVQMLRERKLRLVAPARGQGARRGTAGVTRDNKRGLTWRADGKGLAFLQLEPVKKKKKEKKDVKGGGEVKSSQQGKQGKPSKQGKQDKKAMAGVAKDVDKKPVQVVKKDKKPKRKDRVMLWLPPYSDKSVKVVWESEDAIQSVGYSQDCRTLFITQRKDGKTKLFAVDLRHPAKRLAIHEKKDTPQTSGPGRSRRRGGRSRAGLMMKRGTRGGRVVRVSTDGKHVYMSGVDQPKDRETEDPRSWIDRVTIGTAEKKRVWQAVADMYERVLTVRDDNLDSLIISRESKTTIPDSWLLSTKNGKLTQLTQNIDPAPKVTGAKRLRIKVTRVDGFKFWVNVTIPREYGQKLPALFWFYPREYTSQKAYDDSQNRRIKNRFPRLGSTSKDLLTLLGYVVVAPDCPIVGEQGRMNDNYVADLRNSLWAVIDELDKRNIIDRDRLAIGGHSYGAFGTANALAHTPFFKAGIAGDGNYNRTLTPMAFQSERRYIWQARETYIRMSPILWANQVNGALLMYHGADDNNSGTFPIHSPRMFQALNGLGKPTAMYMYPYESHGPRAKETIMDLWARWVEWLDLYVKHPERAKQKAKQKDKSKKPDTVNPRINTDPKPVSGSKKRRVI